MFLELNLEQPKGYTSSSKGVTVEKKLHTVVFSLLVVLAMVGTAIPANAHHNPRLFTNKKGDHGGTYSRGRHTFFWLPGEKRFKYLTVCMRKRGANNRLCKRFKIHRVPAASYEPWGVDFKTRRHFQITTGAWNVTFWRRDRRLSPILGFHRYR
jgi:hypothetical protein